MKNLTLSLGRVALVLIGALSLGACNRAEYTPLSRSAAAATSEPIAVQQVPANSAAAEGSATVVAAAPTAASEELVIAVAPQPVPVAAPAVATRPAAAPVAAKATAAAKLSLVQRLAVRKVTKQLDKLTSQASQIKKHDATASTARLDGNLRSGLLFLVLGLLVALFSGVSSIFGLIGGILAVIGVVFIVLWLLDQA